MSLDMITTANAGLPQNCLAFIISLIFVSYLTKSIDVSTSSSYQEYQGSEGDFTRTFFVVPSGCLMILMPLVTVVIVWPDKE